MMSNQISTTEVTVDLTTYLCMSKCKLVGVIWFLYLWLPKFHCTLIQIWIVEPQGAYLSQRVGAVVLIEVTFNGSRCPEIVARILITTLHTSDLPNRLFLASFASAVNCVLEGLRWPFVVWRFLDSNPEFQSPSTLWDFWFRQNGFHTVQAWDIVHSVLIELVHDQCTSSLNHFLENWSMLLCLR